MEHAQENIGRWAGEGREKEFPKWEELPQIPLYMDQVILYLGEGLSLFQREEDTPLLTNSMINNYVKNGVLPHPEKKKYSRAHLAGLLMICMLKPQLSLQDIKTLFSGEEISEELFRFFWETHTRAMKEVCQSLEEGLAGEEPLYRQALRLAAEANAKRAAAERILCELGREKEK